MINKISSKIGVLRKLKYIVPSDTLMTLYNAIVLPHFDYADLIYDSGTSIDLERLQKLQTKAACILTNSNNRTPREAMLRTLKWLSLKNRRTFNKGVQMYKCFQCKAPDYLCDLFTTKNHTYATRNSHKLNIPRAKTAYFQNSFQISAAHQWNNLPRHVKNAKTLKSFKCSLFNHLAANNQF